MYMYVGHVDLGRKMRIAYITYNFLITHFQ